MTNDMRQVYVDERYSDKNGKVYGSFKRGFFHGFVIQNRGFDNNRVPARYEEAFGIIEYEDGTVSLLSLNLFKFTDTSNMMHEMIWFNPYRGEVDEDG